MVNAPPGPSLPADLRPFDETPIHTSEMPDTPMRDRNVPAEAWIEAPAALLTAGDDIPDVDGVPVRTAYKRRLGMWLLWRAGPARGDALYMALHSGDLLRIHRFRLYADGSGEGTGPDGLEHGRFRDWKRSLVDTP